MCIVHGYLHTQSRHLAVYTALLIAGYLSPPDLNWNTSNSSYMYKDTASWEQSANSLYKNN